MYAISMLVKSYLLCRRVQTLIYCTMVYNMHWHGVSQTQISSDDPHKYRDQIRLLTIHVRVVHMTLADSGGNRLTH